jgi:hypothetical protein
MIRRRAILFLIALLVPALACQSITSPQAFNFVVADTLNARTLNGTPLGARNTLSVGLPAVFPIDGSLSFDLTFDIDASGKAVLIPVSKVGACTRTCQVGMQVVGDSTFDQITKARSKGYTYDTSLTVDVGKPIIVVAKSTVCASDLYSNDLYAKMIVDSVRTTDRTIFFRIVTDPNCGFRSLVPGVVPKN